MNAVETFELQPCHNCHQMTLSKLLSICEKCHRICCRACLPTDRVICGRCVALIPPVVTGPGGEYQKEHWLGDFIRWDWQEFLLALLLILMLLAITFIVLSVWVKIP